MNLGGLKKIILISVIVIGVAGYFVLTRTSNTVSIDEALLACKEFLADPFRSDPRLAILNDKYSELQPFSPINAIVYQDTAYFIGGDQRQHIYTLDLVSGTSPHIFLTALTAPILKLSVIDGRLYYSTHIQKDTDNGQLYAVDLSNNRQLWRFNTTERIFTTPLLFNSTLYFGDNNGWFYAVDKESGEKLWGFDAGRSVFGSTYGHDKIWVGNSSGYLYGLNSQTGVVEFERKFEPEYFDIEPLSIKNNLLCFNGRFVDTERDAINRERMVVNLETGEIYKVE